MKYEFFIVLGLQRTGTNWVKSIIDTNLSGKNGERVFNHWKHLTPLGVQEKKYIPETMDPDRLNLRDDVLYVATQKPLEMWRTSVTKFPANYNNTHKYTKERPREFQEEIWNSWDQWKNEQMHRPNFYFKEYIDWLYNWETYLAEIQDMTGWERIQDKWTNVERVNMSPDFDITRYPKP